MQARGSPTPPPTQVCADAKWGKEGDLGGASGTTGRIDLPISSPGTRQICPKSGHWNYIALGVCPAHGEHSSGMTLEP